MGTRRKRERQQDLWIATSDVVETPANAFYDRLNQIAIALLEYALFLPGFDERVDGFGSGFGRLLSVFARQSGDGLTESKNERDRKDEIDKQAQWQCPRVPGNVNPFREASIKVVGLRRSHAAVRRET